MKATIVLVGNTDAQNYGGKILLEAHKLAKTGFEMTRLPFHVSLKQPFLMHDLKEFENFFDKFAKTVNAMEIPFEEMVLSPNSSIGGTPSGCLALRAARIEELDILQRRFFYELTEKFGPCPAEHDDDYIFHMTLAVGNAPYENYTQAYQNLKTKPIPKQLVFDKIALFYYDDDSIAAGTYFCYKSYDLQFAGKT